jgi:hypothetical protein
MQPQELVGNHLATLLQQHLVVLAERYAKNYRRDILKAVDPFLSLAALTTNIEHTLLN